MHLIQQNLHITKKKTKLIQIISLIIYIIFQINLISIKN